MLGMRALAHPDRDQIDLAAVLDALSDPTRLAIVVQLADGRDDEARCGKFLNLGSKTNLAYHFAKLRSSGVVRTRIAGTSRYISLRRGDLDARFPGLLAMIVASARSSAKPRRGARAQHRTARRTSRAKTGR